MATRITIDGIEYTTTGMTADDLVAAALDAQHAVAAAEGALARAREERDRRLIVAAMRGISGYRLGKDLGLDANWVRSIIRDAHPDNR